MLQRDTNVGTGTLVPRVIRKVVACIEIEELSKSFDTAQRGTHLALSEISMAVEEGQFVAIVGPSGCGKSTLLYMVGGFVAPTTGRVRVVGKEVDGPGPDRGGHERPQHGGQPGGEQHRARDTGQQQPRGSGPAGQEGDSQARAHTS